MSKYEHYGNGKEIYQGNPENSLNSQEINSIGTEINQSHSGRNFNQYGKQLQNSNDLSNQERYKNTTASNFTNQNYESKSLNSPNSNNMNYTQNFDMNSNFNNLNGNQTQKQFYNTDGKLFLNNEQYNNNATGMYTNYNYQNNQNMNLMQTQNLTYQSNKKKLESLIENLYDYYYRTKGFFQNDPNELINGI